ncbi:MAG: type II and III secretion system protein [Candidatus Moduliflexus flocculans]|nr:type II and III secretion system protein [Candidatus Moduliflexus flocculans]
MKLGLEVSALENRGTANEPAYAIGTRNAETYMVLRDGETAILGGLIRDEEPQQPHLCSRPVTFRSSARCSAPISTKPPATCSSPSPRGWCAAGSRPSARRARVLLRQSKTSTRTSRCLPIWPRSRSHRRVPICPAAPRPPRRRSRSRTVRRPRSPRPSCWPRRRLRCWRSRAA